MKTIIIIFVILSIASCKQQVDDQEAPTQLIRIEENNMPANLADSMYFINEKMREEQLKSQLLKKEGLIGVKNIIPFLPGLLESRSIHQDTDDYLLDYTYPYLNESINPGFQKFNQFFVKNYLNTERTINEILEDNEIICDTLSIPKFRDQRIINYKLASSKNNLISILLYKENYYSGMLHSTYMFDCINYDIKNQEFMHFDNFFIEGSEKMIYDLINKTIVDNAYTGDTYADCWLLSVDDFLNYKNNFVISDDHIAFYLNDCIICPAHTGEYKVVIPISQITHLIRTPYNSILL